MMRRPILDLKMDTGKPLGHARGEISGCIRYFDYYAGVADKIPAETIPLGPEYLNYTVREPLEFTAARSRDLLLPIPQVACGQHAY